MVPTSYRRRPRMQDTCPERDVVKFIKNDDVTVMCSVPRPQTLGCVPPFTSDILLRHTPLMLDPDSELSDPQFEPTHLGPDGQRLLVSAQNYDA